MKGKRWYLWRMCLFLSLLFICPGMTFSSQLTQGHSVTLTSQRPVPHCRLSQHCLWSDIYLCDYPCKLQEGRAVPQFAHHQFILQISTGPETVRAQ